MSALVILIAMTTACKKTNELTPATTSTESTIVTTEVQPESKLAAVDFRNKFVGTYTGVSVASTIGGQQTVAGTNFKFIVSKVTSTTNKVKVIVILNNGAPQTYTAIASLNKLSFSGASVPGNMSQTIVTSKTSNAAIPIKFVFITGGGFTGFYSKYVVIA